MVAKLLWAVDMLVNADCAAHPKSAIDPRDYFV